MTAQHPRRFLRFSLRTLLIVITLVCVGIVAKQQIDWQRKRQLIHQWIAPILQRVEAAGGDIARYEESSQVAAADLEERLTDDERLAVLVHGILYLDKPVERIAALKILVETRGDSGLPVLRDLVGRTKDRELQALIIHLISLERNPDDLERFEALPEGPSVPVRVAALEAIGNVKQPSYPAFSQIRTNSLPPIDVSSLMPPWPSASQQMIADSIEQDRQSKIAPRFRGRLEQVMLGGNTQAERLAAARALVGWPPDPYTLRVAEWGVWIDNQSGPLLAARVLEENPPFVHAVGNARKSLAVNREYRWVFTVTKPVVHLTADRPLAVDLEVVFAEGRPWFAFPRPDTIVLHGAAPRSTFLGAGEGVGEMVVRKFPELEPSELPALEPLSEGYDWIHPNSRRDARGFALGLDGTSPDAMGLRWQSLIVTPQRPAWANVAQVPDDPKFRWWEALREVPSCWVASQNETERFLYYDGPTMARNPLVATWDGEMLRLEPRTMFVKSGEFERDQDAASKRECLLIDGGPKVRAARWQVSTVAGEKASIDCAEQPWLSGDDVEGALDSILRERGLTPAESAGLITSWRQHLFNSPGRRLLTFLTPAEYDAMCPLSVRPPPTETVRVGIIVSEFNDR